MKNYLKKARIIFYFLLLVLFISFYLLKILPASAHLPVVEDKENYIPALGWIKTFKGLRFTPYTHVDLEEDVVMTKEQVNNFFNNYKKYLWGVYDGIGTPIILTPAVYYYYFIYTQDFIQAEEVRFNKPVKTINTYENHYQIYDNPIVVEYYFSGFNPRFEGMDWESLRLVFEEYENEWKLVGIIHNQWTI